MSTEPNVQPEPAAPKANAAMRPGFGILFQSIAEVWAVADGLRKGGAGPKGATTGSIAASIIKGQSLGLDPVTAMSFVTVVNGRASLMGDLALGLVRKSGLVNPKAGGYLRESWEGEGEARKCVVSAKRSDTGEEMARSFSVAEARVAGLVGKTAMWTAFQDRMLRYRALGFLLRDLFSDILLGLYLTEELQAGDYFEPKAITAGTAAPAAEPATPEPDPLFASQEEPKALGPGMVGGIDLSKSGTQDTPAEVLVNRDGVTLAEVMAAPSYAAAVESKKLENAQEAPGATQRAQDAPIPEPTLFDEAPAKPAPAPATLAQEVDAIFASPAPRKVDLPDDPFEGFREPTKPAPAPAPVVKARRRKL
jgi:hypothetical protein